jgi:hypothetical protein
MLSRVWQFLYTDKGEDHSIGSDERDAFAVVVPFDFENFNIENRKVVGTTAIIDVDKRKISPTEGPRPKKYRTYSPSLDHSC